MLKLLKKALQVGEATVPYPFKPLEVAPDFRGKPDYDFHRCVACGACALACPSNAITLAYDGERGVVTWTLHYGRCIFCGRCEEVCPTGAITLSATFELAATKKEDLSCQAELQLSRCASCGESFAPWREVEYVRAELVRSGIADPGSDEWKQRMKVCPTCRRRQVAGRWVRGQDARREA